MVHLGRHTQRLLWTTGLSIALTLSGCASFRGKSETQRPRLGGESASYFGEGEGIGGERGVARRAPLSNITPTSAETEEDADEDEGSDVIRIGGTMEDNDLEQTSYRRGGGGVGHMLGSAIGAKSCGPGGCATGDCGTSGRISGKVRGGGGGGRNRGPNGRELLEAAGANLGGGSKAVRRDMGTCNPMLPRELRKAQHPLYTIEPPDVLYIEALELLPNRPISGERLVRPDGTISLGYYGQISVASLTLPEIEEKIRKRLEDYVNSPEVYVDVAYFNSKIFYVLGQTQQTGRLPITGNETVLDGIVLAGGITNFADKDRIFLARPNPGGGCAQVLHIDYRGITECGDTRTNYQLLPGDRVVVMPTKGFKATVWMDNYLTPVERITNLFALFRFAVSSRSN